MRLKRKILLSMVLLLCLGFFSFATNTSANTTGGWLLDENNLITTDEDGYFVYTLSEEDIDENGEIIIDGNLLADYMADMMSIRMNQVINVPVKIVNNTGYKITYKDYEFDTVNRIEASTPFTPDMSSATLENSSGYGWGQAWDDPFQALVDNKIYDKTLDATGFDGLPIRSMVAPVRCINPAVISLYGKSSASTITLIEMNNLEEKIKEQNTFKNSKGETITLEADSSRTYAQFLKSYYGVSSFDELSATEKTNILGYGKSGSVGGAAGQSRISNYKGNNASSDDNYIPASALTDGSLEYFQTWGMATVFKGNSQFASVDYPYAPTYFILESDPEVLEMGYEYLYDRCLRITFDNVQYPMSRSGAESYESSAIGMKKYIDKTDTSNAAIEQAFMKDIWIEDGESITIDTLDVGMDLPNAWHGFRYIDFGFSITVKTDKEKAPIVEPEPDPEPKPEPKPDPEPKPTPKPDPIPEPEPTPEGPSTPVVPDSNPSKLPEVEKQVNLSTKPNSSLPLGDQSNSVQYSLLFTLSTFGLYVIMRRMKNQKQ